MEELARWLFQQETPLKRTILVALIAVMMTTPCFAQEEEMDEIFSIAGTEWRCIGVGLQIPPVNRPLIHLYDETVDFSERSVFTASENIGILQWVGSYLDFLVFSVAWDSQSDKTSISHLFMVMQPALGLGMFFEVTRSSRDPKIPYWGIFIPWVRISTGIMIKINGT